MTANAARFAAGLFRDRRASPGYRLLGQIGLVGLMIGIVLSGFFFTNSHQQALLDLREGGRQMRIAQEALMDAEAYVLNKAIGDRDSEVSLFNRAVEALHSRRESQLARLDPHLRTANGAGTSAHDILTALEATWTEALDIARAGRLVEAQALLNERRTAA